LVSNQIKKNIAAISRQIITSRVAQALQSFFNAVHQASKLDGETRELSPRFT
jgi:uncharacterized protein YejL (UPF0352 family)